VHIIIFFNTRHGLQEFFFSFPFSSTGLAGSPAPVEEEKRKTKRNSWHAGLTFSLYFFFSDIIFFHLFFKKRKMMLKEKKKKENVKKKRFLMPGTRSLSLSF